MSERTDMIVDPSVLTGYTLSGAFGLFGVIQLATEDLTGIGMLLIATFSAWSTHISKIKKTEYDRQVEQIRVDSMNREKALEARVKMIVAGVPCDHDSCPVMEIARGRIGAMDCIRLPDAFPFDKIKPAKPSEDTIDVPDYPSIQ